MMLSGRTADGVNVSTPARAVRYPFLRPELKDVKLMLGLPVYQKVDTLFMQCLLALQAQRPCEIEVRICQGDGIARSRNELSSQFLKSDCTHLLFIDCDLIFSADHIARLLSHRKPVIGGFYPKKQQGPLEWVINTLPGNPPKTAEDLQPVRYIGTGFLCIAREVFVQMAEHYPEIRYREDYGERGLAHDFWPMGVYRQKLGTRNSEFGTANEDEGRYLSEDWFFCQRWLDMGGEIFGDARVILKHIGVTTFPLQTQEAEITSPRCEVSGVSADCAEPINRECRTGWTVEGCPE